MKTRTKLLTSIIAIMLSCVLLFTFVMLSKNTNNSEMIAAKTRSVELSISPEYEAYLTDFNEKTINYNDNHITFYGIMDYNEDVLSMFDQVALIETENTDQYNISYDCSLDMDTLQFTFKAMLIDEDNESQIIEEIVTDAFVTESGQLDAFIELDGETYLISDFISSNAIDECLFGWLSALIAVAVVAVVVVVVVAVYVVVAETAEQIKAKSNYEHNKQLENANNGVNYGNYITRQSEKNRRGYNSGDYLFGFTTFDKVGCEVASVYNLLISLGKTEMLSETIFNFEKWAIEYSIGFGHFGSNPKDIYRYLNKRNISYKKYTSYSTFTRELVKKSNCHVIMSCWNNGGMLKSIFNGVGLHTYYFKKQSVNKFSTYNLRYSNSFITYSNIDDIYSAGGDFIVAYIIN